MKTTIKVLLTIIYLCGAFVMFYAVYDNTTDRIKIINFMNEHESSSTDSLVLKYKGRDLFYKTIQVEQNIPLNERHFNPNDSEIVNIKKCFKELKFKKLIIIGTNDTVSYEW